MGKFTAQNLANTALAFTMEGDFDAQDLANMAWAFAKETSTRKTLPTCCGHSRPLVERNMNEQG